MENLFYSPSYANRAFFEEQNKPIDTYAFQEKFFLDGYGIAPPIPISPPITIFSPTPISPPTPIFQPAPIPQPAPISPPGNVLEQQAFPENQAKQIAKQTNEAFYKNNALYKEAIRESVQKIFVEILLLAALFRYYKNSHYFQDSPQAYPPNAEADPDPYSDEYPGFPITLHIPAFGKAPHRPHKNQTHNHNNDEHRRYRDLETGMPQSRSYNELLPHSAQNNLYNLYRWLGHDAKTFAQIESNNIIAQAHHNIGRPVWAFTRFASVCESGNLGCAATVSELLQDAGVKIAGSASVVGVITQLSNLGWQQIKISNKSQFRSGDIVFGLNNPHAHIGIITQANNGTILVCDNSSSSGTLKERTIEAGGSFTPHGRFAGHLYVMRKENS